MTIFRIAVLLLVASATSVRATGDHELLAAQMELKIAKDHLQAAGTEYAGHRRAAMNHIDEALKEIRQALDVAKGGAGQRPKRQVGEPATPPGDDD
jgi:hypothetical protein